MSSVELIDWFTRYKEFSTKLTLQKVESDKQRFQEISINIKKIQQVIDDRHRRNAPNYNIFYILKYIIDKEEQIHSPFLADLLNVHGKHKQGDLFYNEFLTQLKLFEADKRFAIDNKIYFSCSTERWIGNGSIDIILEYNSPNKRFAIAIENKIFAKDQERQLERYSNYLEQEYGNKFLLLYLTPNERNPHMPFSIAQEHFSRLSENNLIGLITYRKHIANLLRNSMPSIESPNLSFILNQYLQIIKNNFKHG